MYVGGGYWCYVPGDGVCSVKLSAITENKNMDQKATVEALFESFNARSVDFLRSITHSKSRMTVDGGRSFILGSESIVATVGASFLLIPDLRVKTVTLLSVGNVVMAEVVREGMHTGELELPDGTSIAPTHNQVFLPEVIVFRFENKTISLMSVYTDQLDTQKQLGLL